MNQITRGFGLQMIAGAAGSTLSGSAGVAEASVDPAFAAIAKHRQASADHLASIEPYDWAERGQTPTTPPETITRPVVTPRWMLRGSWRQRYPRLSPASLPISSTRTRWKTQATNGRSLTPSDRTAGIINCDKRWPLRQPT